MERRYAIPAAILAIVVSWFALGSLRAPAVARDYLERTERPKQVSQVTTATFPGIPPFWIVRVDATVAESTGTSYLSARTLLVEPVTGFVLSMGAG